MKDKTKQSSQDIERFKFDLDEPEFNFPISLKTQKIEEQDQKMLKKINRQPKIK